MQVRTASTSLVRKMLPSFCSPWSAVRRQQTCRGRETCSWRHGIRRIDDGRDLSHERVGSCHCGGAGGPRWSVFVGTCCCCSRSDDITARTSSVVTRTNARGHMDNAPPPGPGRTSRIQARETAQTSVRPDSDTLHPQRRPDLTDGELAMTGHCMTNASRIRVRCARAMESHPHTHGARPNRLRHAFAHPAAQLRSMSASPPGPSSARAASKPNGHSGTPAGIS